MLSWALCLLSWAVWLLSWPAALLGWALLLLMTLRAALGPEAVSGLHSRLVAWVTSRFVGQQEAHLAAIKADLFRPMAEMKSAAPELTGGALDILEVSYIRRRSSLSRMLDYADTSPCSDLIRQLPYVYMIWVLHLPFY